MFLRNYLRQRLIISMVSVIAIVAIISVTSYALFMDVTSNTNDQVLTVGDLQITFIDGSERIDINNIRPMNDSAGRAQSDNIYTFTVNNVGNLAYHYTISILNNPDFTTNLLPHQFIRYSLNGGAVNVLGDQTDGIVYDAVLNPGASRTFTLQLWVGGGDQTNPTLGLPNEALGSEIHLNIEVDGRAGFDDEAVFACETGRLCDAILNANVVRTDADFSVVSNNANVATQQGLFQAPDEHGTAHFFRGTHAGLNNNVIFAGHQWKILRIEGNGNIRMIYNGVCPNNACTINGATAGAATTIGSSAINTTGNHNRLIGYMFGSATGTFNQQHANVNNSTIKTAVDNWFNTNITGANRALVADDTVFCLDRSLSSGTGLDIANTTFGIHNRLSNGAANFAPTLICPRAEDRLTLPVGLISQDETNMAGARWGLNNTDFFLRTNQEFWSISPSGFNETANTATGHFITINGDMAGNTVTVPRGIRPVISLNANVLLTELENMPDGSLWAPFIVSDCSCYSRDMEFCCDGTGSGRVCNHCAEFQ